MKICLTGADGAGKSTIIAEIAKQLDAKKISNSICSIWDTMSFFHQYFDAKPTKESIQKYLISCDKNSRIYFLLHSMAYSLHQAKAKKSEIILIDGHWYKYLLSEASNHDDLAQLLNICELFEKPDLVFYLNLPIDEAIKRKTLVGFSKYELRGQNLEEGLNFFKANFIKMEKMFDTLIDQSWTSLDATKPIDELTQIILKDIIKI